MVPRLASQQAKDALKVHHYPGHRRPCVANMKNRRPVILQESRATQGLTLPAGTGTAVHGRGWPEPMLWGLSPTARLRGSLWQVPELRAGKVPSMAHPRVEARQDSV
jgi:hypothetical protein